jgi:hypothetical protein
MRVKVLIFATAGLFLIASTSPAPAPHYLAINYSTKQCGEYWPGDEYVNYDLPPGWTTYQYGYSRDNWFVETPSGTCSVPQPLARSSFAEVCCSQFGYTYVADNIGSYRLTADNIANQKFMKDYAEKQAAQETAKRIQPIILYAIVFFSLALLVMVIVQWLYEKRTH